MILIGVLALASVAGFTLIVSHLTRSQIEQDAFTLQRHPATRMAAQMAQAMNQPSTEPRPAGARVPQRSWFVQGSRGLYCEGTHEATLLPSCCRPCSGTNCRCRCRCRCGSWTGAWR